MNKPPIQTSSGRLMACPACGCSISRTAPSCPHCGHVNQRVHNEQQRTSPAYQGCMLVVFIGLAFVAITMWGGC